MFTNKGRDIFKNNEWYCSAGGEHCAEVISTALNELNDEIYRLEQTVAQLVREAKETSQEKYNIQPYAIIMKKKDDVE